MSDVTTIADLAAYHDAVDRALRASADYYANGASALDDDAFDSLLRGIVAFEALHPDNVRPDSPAGKVAGGVMSGTVTHTVRMLSLDNVFSEETLAERVASVERRIGRQVQRWTVAVKLDGLALAVRYEQGRLVRLLTRGDGITGEDMSHAIGSPMLTLVGLPDRLARPVSLEVRGEVLATRDQFEQANLARTGAGGAPFANARSAAVGSLRTQDRTYPVALTFYAYGVLPRGDEAGVAEEENTSFVAAMEEVAGLGVNTIADTPAGLAVCHTAGEIQTQVNAIGLMRGDLPFGIDGAVIRVDSPDDARDAGESSRAPRWAVAYKFAAESKTTQLLEVIWAVGRTGVIAPTARLAPVQVDGSEIEFATLHNPSIIAQLGLLIGDTVEVIKAGDVIPRVQAPVVELRTGDETPIVIPPVCPSCGGEIDKSQERWRCLQGRVCGALPAIEYAIARDQLDIESLGGMRIRHLIAEKLIEDFADVFTLTRDQLMALEGMADVSVDKLLGAIETARTRDLSRVFCALGVLGTGRSMSRRIARHFGTMQAIRNADVEAVQQVEGIGPKKAEVIVAELAQIGPLIDKLVAAGVNMTEPGALPQTADGDDGPMLPLAGMTICVTGAMTGPLETYTRNAMNDLIERLGGKASSSVSKTTTLLVAAAASGSKHTNAVKLGVQIETPEQFARRMEGHLA